MRKINKNLFLIILFVFLFSVLATNQLQLVKASNTDIQISPLYHDIFYNDTYGLQYPTYDNGYLFVVRSHDAVLGDLSILKFNATTNILIQETVLDPAILMFECFSAQAYNGLLYLCGASWPSFPTQAVLVVLNETTLSQVAVWYSGDWHIANYLTTMAVDTKDNLLLFGADIQNGSFGFFKVAMANSSDPTAYQFVNVANNSYALASECTPILFNNKVYVVCMSVGDGTNYVTALYSSSNLVVWTLEWQNSMVNTAPGSYFPHIACTDNYLTVGLITNQTTGVSTYRIAYTDTSLVWSYIDTNYSETANEDQPIINSLPSDGLFLYEISTRSLSVTPEIFMFDATIGNLTSICNVTTYTGFNDRIIAVDSINQEIYVANNLINGTLKSSLIKLDYAFYGVIPVVPTERPVLIQNVYTIGLGAIGLFAIVPIISVMSLIIAVVVMSRNPESQIDSKIIITGIVFVVVVNIVALVAILLLNSINNIL